MAERRADVTWNGDLITGSGTIDSVRSGAFALTVRGSVPGLEEGDFRAAAEDAKRNCPVSKALAGVREITLDSQLDD